MEDKKNNIHNKKLTPILLFLLLIAICIVIGLFAMAKYTKDYEHTISLKFKKVLLEEQNITCTPTTKAKTVKVTIANENGGKIQYKIGESGTWTDYTEEFEVIKNDDVYAKLVFSDGESSVTVKKIENIIEEPRVTINAQEMIGKNRIINAIRWC